MGPTTHRAPRQARSRETHARIVEAASELFVENGYVATTMAAIASAAGVAVQSLYLRFGGKLEILSAAFDAAIVGDVEPLPLLEREWAKQMDQSLDGRRAVEIFMGAMCELMQRTYPLYAVVRSTATETGELLEENKRQRYEGLHQIASVLSQMRGFRRELTIVQTADRLYALVSEDAYGLLVAERGWEPVAWREWCSQLLLADLFMTRSKNRAHSKSNKSR